MYNGFPRKKTDNEAESLTPFPPQHTIAKTERNARQWIAAAGRTAWSLIVALETEKGVGETLVPEKLVPGNQRNKRVKTSRWQPPRFYDFTTILPIGTVQCSVLYCKSKASDVKTIHFLGHCLHICWTHESKWRVICISYSKNLVILRGFFAPADYHC